MTDSVVKIQSNNKVWILAFVALLLSLFFAQSSRLGTETWLVEQPSAQALNAGWHIVTDSKTLHENAAFSVVSSLKSQQCVEISNILPTTSDDCLSVVTIGFQVSAFVDSKPIYTFGDTLDSTDVWSVKTHMIALPDGVHGRSVMLTFHTDDPRSIAVSSNILLGSEASIITVLLKSNIYAVVLSAFFIFVGLFSLLFSLISMTLKRRKRYVPLMALSMIALLMGSNIFFNLSVVAYYVGPIAVHWIISINNLALPVFVLLFVAADTGIVHNKPLMVTAAVQSALLCAWVVCNLLGWNFFLHDWHSMLTVVVVLLLAIVFLREIRKGVSRPDVAAAIALIFVMSLLDAIQYYTYGSYSSMDFYLMIGALPVLILMTGRAALRFIQEEQRILNENAALRIEGDMLYKNYAQTEKYIEETRLIWHDIDKHLSVIRQLTQNGDYHELQQYLAKIGHDIRTAKDYVLCDNKLINAILTDKLADAKSQGIAVSCTGNLPDKLNIPGNDLCSLLVNIIENAIEACLKMANSQEMRIDITLAYKNGFSYFHVSNSSAGTPRMTGDSFLTSKTDNVRHGFGISIIQRIVAKYHGALDIVPGENSFLVKVALKDEPVG